MEKFLKRVVLIFIIFILCLGNIALADDELEEPEYELSEEVSADLSSEPETYSKHIICIERSTGEILYEKDAYTKTAMASTTKIMTAIIALENSNLSDIVEISKKSANTGGSTLGITAGSKMTMESLLYGLLLRSRK